MAKSKKRKKIKNKKNVFIFFILIVIIAAVSLTFEIKNLMKIDSAKQTAQNSASEGEQASEGETENADTYNELITFDTFADKVYEKEELESMTKSDVVELTKIQKNNLDLDIDKVVGTVGSSDNARKLTKKSYENQNQTVNSTEVIGETDLYYIVEVNYDYINGNVTKRYTQKVLAFKEFYYDEEEETFNLDDVENVKKILDLDKYITNYSNAGKRLVQSFMEKEGQKCEYILYYLNISYGEEGKNDTADLIKETISINPATGKIEGKTQTTIVEGAQI